MDDLKKHDFTYKTNFRYKTNCDISYKTQELVINFLGIAITCSKLTIETVEQRCEICSKLTIKLPKRRRWRRFGGCIVNFEHIWHLCSSVSIVNFEQVNVGLVALLKTLW